MSMVELAPQHKTGLRLSNPVMVAAGCYGLGIEYRALLEVGALGAVVVGPVTMRARPGAAPPRSLPVPGGVLLHTGLANPGLPTTLHRYGRAWKRSAVPVILHLAATSPGEVVAACRRLNTAETVSGVELGLRDDTEPDEAAALVAAAREVIRQPLLVRLPLTGTTSLAARAVEAGADVLTVAAPPRGTVLHQGRFVTGRLYGPFTLPLALRALRRVTKVVDVPLVGCGGIYSADDALAFLRAGATAVQVDAALWRDPSSPARIAREVAARLGRETR
ncbi:MAG TPA: dihydroorotate dehydrogenase [Anaerolineae bacterium]|nr:dihydroorotate dehydrogenase [Anaerolineae bacterium]